MTASKRRPDIDERHLRDHPNNAAARWHLNRAYQRGLLSGTLEDKKKRLDPDGMCSAATPEESRAFADALWSREVDE